MLSNLLAKKGCNSVFWECGPKLATAAIKAGCIQELMTFIAPKILGGDNNMNAFADFEFTDMKEVLNLNPSEFRIIRDDIFIKSTFLN